MKKVAVVVSHPIQHFCPQYFSWAKLPGVELKVFFASKHGLAPYEDHNFARTIQWSGMSLDFPHEFLQGAKDRELGTNIDSPDVEEHLFSFSPDVLIVYGYSQYLQRRALRWSVKNDIPVLMITDSELRTRRNVFKSLIKKIILPRIFRQVSLFLTVGDANETYYRRYGIADTQFVRCFFPIDCRNYDAVLSRRTIARAKVRSELSITDNHKVILNVGKLVPWKRQKDLVKFANALQGQRNDVTVVLVGTGRDEDILKRDCLNKKAGGVIFAGFVPPDILAEYYCAADVYVHCSEHEPHSLAISEAIYCGLPVVISDRCGSYGPTDDVRNGLNGLVYHCGDIDDLSGRLLNIVNENEVRMRMAKVSEQISRQHQTLAHGKALEQALVVLDSYQDK